MELEWCVICTGLLVLTYILYLYLTWHHDYWKVRGIAYQPALPIFGSMIDFVLMKRSGGIILSDIYNKFTEEKVVGLFSMGRKTPWLLLRDPTIIHKVLVADFHHFADNECSYVDEDLDPFVTKSLFFQKGETWKRLRILLTPAFTSGKVRGMYPQIHEVVQEFVAHMKEKTVDEIQLQDVTRRYTSEIVARLAYGINGKSFTDKHPVMIKMGEDIFQTGFKFFLKFILLIGPSKIRKIFKIRMAPKNVTDTLEGILHDVVTFRKNNTTEFHDFIQHLIDVHEKAEGFTKADIMANTLLFFVEGYENITAMLSHLLYNLAVNPECQEKLFTEVNAVYAEFKGNVPCDTVSDMNYLNRVFLESARVFPVLFGLAKVCTETYSMDIGRKEPLIIEKGTPVFIPTYSIHTDPVLWEDPHSFDPERFAKNECTAFKSKGMYLPFGDGPRMCIGSRLAIMIVKLAVFHVVHAFKIVPSPRTPKKIELDSFIYAVGHKGGLYLNIIPRQ